MVGRFATSTCSRCFSSASASASVSVTKLVNLPLPSFSSSSSSFEASGRQAFLSLPSKIRWAGASEASLARFGSSTAGGAQNRVEENDDQSETNRSNLSFANNAETNALLNVGQMGDARSEVLRQQQSRTYWQGSAVSSSGLLHSSHPNRLSSRLSLSLSPSSPFSGGGGVAQTSSRRGFSSRGESEGLKKEGSKQGTGEGEKLNRSGAAMKYGATFIGCYATLYAIPLGMIYGSLSTGLLGGADAIQLLKPVLDKLAIDPSSLNSTYSNMGLSLAMNECLEIVRTPLALALTPMVAKSLGRKTLESAENVPATAATTGGRAGGDGDGPSKEGGDKPKMGKLAMEAKMNSKIEMFKRYGITFFLWWTGLWAASWAGLYLALDNGLMGGQDGIAFLLQIPYLEHFIDVNDSSYSAILENRELSNIGVSFIMNEVLELGRFPIAVATTPLVAKALGVKPKST